MNKNINLHSSSDSDLFTYTELDDFLAIIIPTFSISGNIDMSFEYISQCLDMMPTNTFQRKVARLSKYLDVIPTDTWQQANETIQKIKEIAKSTWSYTFPKEDSIWIEDNIDTVLKKFFIKRDIISHLKNEKIISETSIHFTVYVTNKYPLFSLSSDMLSKLSLFQTNLSMDIFSVEKFEEYEKPLVRQSWKKNEDGYNVWIVQNANSSE
jgi:hypothetical protein